MKALKPVLNDFVNEVQRSLGYFTNTHRDAQILYMIGLGNAFRLPGLQKFLQEKLDLEVRKLQNLENLFGEEVTSAPQFKENILSFAVAYGLALQGLEETKLGTNLLPQEIRTARKIREKKPWAAAAAAVLLIGVASLSFGMATRYQAFANKEVESALKTGEQYKGQNQGHISTYNEFEQKAKESEETVKRIGSGIDQRYNWPLIYEFINDTLPQYQVVNGQIQITRITGRTRDNKLAYSHYFTKKAQDAFLLWRQKQLVAGKELTSEKQQEEEEKNIKPHLLQVNIEGITCIYSDDLSGFFSRLATNENALFGMGQAERENVKNQKTEVLPKKGWIFEIRGYTYHEDEEDFVIDTLVENLARPHKVGIIPEKSKEWVNHKYFPVLFFGSSGGGGAVPGMDAASPLDASTDSNQPEAEKTYKSRISYAFLYKNTHVENPQPGTLLTLNQSLLPQLLTAPPTTGTGTEAPPGMVAQGAEGGAAVGKSRADWRPIGEVASTLIKDGPQQGFGERPAETNPVIDQRTGKKNGQQTIKRQTRVEFFVIFIWQEPTMEQAEQGDGGSVDGSADFTIPPG